MQSKYGYFLIAGALVLGVNACSSNSDARSETFLRELKSDPTLGDGFASGEFDEEMVQLARDICDDFRRGSGLLDVAMAGNEVLGIDIEVSTQIAILAALNYCPEIEVGP